jgi:AraC-like DNA-binding protein
VLVLAIEDADAAPLVGRVADPDAVARLAERDRAEAARLLLSTLTPRALTCADWPDLLAQALHADPALPLTPWAHARGLHLGSLSRGFRQVFGVAPVAYRLVQRTRRAMEAVRHSNAPLSLIAADSGFADQAHMSRAIRSLANTTPRALRRLAA